MPDIPASNGAARPTGLASPSQSASAGAPSGREGAGDRSAAPSPVSGAGERQPSNSAPPTSEFTGQVPTDITGYRLGASEALAPHMGALETDDLFNTARAFAQRAGVTDKQFDDFVRPTLECVARQMAADGGAGQQGFNAEAELGKLAQQEWTHLDPAGRAAVMARVEGALNFAEGLKGQGLDAEVVEFLIEQLGDDARGILALEWLSAHGQGLNRQEGGMGLNDRINDPRNDPRNKRFDPAFAAETDRLSRAQFPERQQTDLAPPSPWPGLSTQAPPSPWPGAGNGGGGGALSERLNDPRNDPRSPRFDRAFAAETDRLFQHQFGW